MNTQDQQTLRDVLNYIMSDKPLPRQSAEVLLERVNGVKITQDLHNEVKALVKNGRRRLRKDLGLKD